MASGLGLSVEERSELKVMARSRRLPAAPVKRARMLLLLDDGLSWKAVSAQTPCSQDFIARWKRRFEQSRLAGLYARHRGKPPAPGAPKLQARILAFTQQRQPADGATHWSTRKLARELGVSHMMVARVWAEHGLQPHRLEHYRPPTIPTLRPRRPTLSGCIWPRRRARRCFAWTKRPRFRRWTGWTRCCRCRRAAPSATGLSITATGRSPCMPPSTPNPAKCWARQWRGTPARSSWPFLAISWPISPEAKRFTLSVTIFPLIRPRPCAIS